MAKTASTSTPLTELIEQLKDQLESSEAQDVPHAELLTLLPVVSGSLQKKSEWYSEQEASIREEVSTIRNALPGDEPTVQTRTRTRKVKTSEDAEVRNPRSEGLLSDFVYRAVKSFKRTGGNRDQITAEVIKLGWKPRDKDKFTNSVYVSGIRKLVDEGKIEGTRDGREMYYRAKS